MCLSAQEKTMRQNRHSRGFHLAYLSLVLCPQPVLCHLILEGSGMALLSLFLAVCIMLGTWWDSGNIYGIISNQLSCLLLVTQKLSNKNFQVLNCWSLESCFLFKEKLVHLLRKLQLCSWPENIYFIYMFIRLSRWCSGKESYQCRRCKRRRFEPWVKKIPCRRKWKPTPVFLPKISQGGLKRVIHN